MLKLVFPVVILIAMIVLSTEYNNEPDRYVYQPLSGEPREMASIAP